MNKTAGTITIHPNGYPDRAFDIECHVEDEVTWGGYSLINPFGGYQDFSKGRYTLIEDFRQEVKL